MLILTRKLGQSITIGDDIKITVLDIHGRQVRLGITAPHKVVVHREEIYQKIQDENRRAVSVSANDLEQAEKLIASPYNKGHAGPRGVLASLGTENGVGQDLREVKQSGPDVDKKGEDEKSNP